MKGRLLGVQGTMASLSISIDRDSRLVTLQADSDDDSLASLRGIPIIVKGKAVFAGMERYARLWKFE